MTSKIEPLDKINLNETQMLETDVFIADLSANSKTISFQVFKGELTLEMRACLFTRRALFW
jgi:hypothetical protein